MARRSIVITALIVLAAIAGVVWMQGCKSRGSSKPTLVLYCATDREIVQDLIDQFERQTGIHVDIKFDTEAAKSVGLVQEIRQEKSHPQCDVLWGGGAFYNTILANDGCLTPFPDDLIAAHGTAPRDPQGRWLGFAGVYRILIVNTDVLKPEDRPHSIFDLTDPKFKGHIGIANPLFGAMDAHIAALCSTIGEEKTRQWLKGLKANDCALCAGMADVKNRVASGELWCGITSTIDAHVAITGGKPVVVIFPDQDENQIGCMNGYGAVGRIAGGPHPKEAEQFLRFLMTTQTEKILADGPGQNIGLLPESIKQDVRPEWIPRNIKSMNVDWEKAVASHPASAKAIKQILFDE